MKAPKAGCVLFLLTVIPAAMAANPHQLEGRRHASPKIVAQYGKLPLYFIENKGQLDRRVRYYVQGRDNSIYFTPDGVTLLFTQELRIAQGNRCDGTENRPEAEGARLGRDSEGGF